MAWIWLPRNVYDGQPGRIDLDTRWSKTKTIVYYWFIIESVNLVIAKFENTIESRARKRHYFDVCQKTIVER